MKIDGSVALIAGASSGIGAAIAVEFARRGAIVVVTARRATELEAVAERCRSFTADSLAVTGDLAQPSDCERVVLTTREQLGRVDILVNNAGISMRRHVLDTSPADLERVLQINFLAAVHTTAAVLPAMVERGRGSVVNVTSVAGSIPNPRESAYGASKAALHLWMHALAVDLDATGVHVGVLSPGPIDTDIWDHDEIPASYRGRKYPPEVVAAAAARMVEKERAQPTVPRRFGAVGILYELPLISRAIRHGLVRFERAGERRRHLSSQHVRSE